MIVIRINNCRYQCQTMKDVKAILEFEYAKKEKKG